MLASLGIPLPCLFNPEGPKIEKIQDRPPGLKFSSEIENFKRAAQHTPIFCGEIRRSRLNISSVIENFKRDFIFPIFGPLGKSGQENEKKQKQGTKRQQKGKTRRKKERKEEKRERQRKRNTKRGRPKRLRAKERETLKINKNALF